MSSVGLWDDLLDAIGDDSPPAIELAEALADARGLDVPDAQDRVYAAIDEGVLVEDGDGFGSVRLAGGEDTTVSGENGEESREEPDTPDATPTPEAEDTDLRERAHDAFADAIKFYHNQLDTELPVEYADTARGYYENVRGWSTDTVDGKLLGYAPGDCRDELIAFLHGKGHDRDAIQASGLFYEGGLKPHFNGRFVLPYFNEDGEPVYAISRSIDEDNGGHPDDHHGDQKYTKVIKAQDYSEMDEPVYGLSTVDEDTDRLLVAGGIADAITLHEAGYACVSPVTTVRFKNKHEARVLELIDEYDIEGVYMLNDAERPTVDARETNESDHAKIGDVLTIQAYGEGLRGAFGNTEFLQDADAETYLVDLPGGDDDLRKLDPDDYVKEGWGSVETLLASAKPAGEHRSYQRWKDNQRTRAVAQARQNKPAGASSGGEKSALFRLSFTDVSGLSDDFRGENPQGHHGESGDYFVVIDGDTDLGYDHKYGVAYNALTYLLVDAGERRASSPSGPFSDEEMFVAWKHAKDEGHISDEDDPIPLRALQHVARETTEWDGDLVEQTTADGDTFDGLPSSIYNAALDHVREEYDVDPGRHQVGEGDEDAEPVAPLALERLDAVADHERQRVAKNHGVEIPPTADAREDLRNDLMREMRAGNKTVLDAPTALGKSHTVATEPWLLRASTTGEAPVVHLHATKDARDEAAAESGRASSVDHAVLKGRKERCPVARGDHDPTEDPEKAPEQVITVAGEAASAWLDTQCDEKGLPFSTAHAFAREYNDQDLDVLPCCEEGDCPAVRQWDGLPRDDDGNAAKDVIHATHQLAHVPSLRRGTNVVLDEQPDFAKDLTKSGSVEAETARVRSIVNAYLDEIDAPTTTWESFVQLARLNTGGDNDATRIRDALDDAIGTDPRTEWYVEHPDAHAFAPDLAKAVWDALRWEDPDANGRRSARTRHEPPRLDTDGEGYAGTYLTVVVDDENNVRSIRAVPDFNQARSVVGLDAHPSMPMWQLNAHPSMTRDTVLDSTERQLWRRYERGLTVVQVGEATRPRSGSSAAEWMNDDRVRAVVDRLRDHYGGEFKTAITTGQVERQVRGLLAEADDRVTPDNTMHYGEEKSRNDFADESAGLLYGCMDPGDDMILDALAELGVEAVPETAETEAGDVVRAKGRGFEGPEAGKAESILESVRENHVAQAAGRYARNPDDPESSAVVFAMTDAHPTGFVDVETPGVEWLATDLQREIIDELAERPSATAREIADAVDCSKEHVRQTLGKLDDDGLLDRHEGAGDYGADLFRVHDDEAADVDLGFSEIANDALCYPSRWSLAITFGNHVDTTPEPGESRGPASDRSTSDDAAGGAPPR